MATPHAQDGTSPKADDGDWLGYGAYADALWGRIQTALIKSEGSTPYWATIHW